MELEDAVEYEVEAILRHRKTGRRRRKLEYLVKFVGYDASYNEWLPAVNLTNASDLVRQYHESNPL